MNAVAELSDHQRYAAALAGLGAGPAGLRRLLDGHSPPDAWDAVVAGRHPADPERRLRAKATPRLLHDVEAACRACGADVRLLGEAGYPPALAADAEAPAVLFTRGDPAVLEGRPRVAVVGTRSATAYGTGVATELGAGLAEARVVVVSGLARGIDAAAHAGALGQPTGAAPVGVPGAAFDARRPPSLAALTDAIAGRGALLGEQPPGTRGARWTFAVRNRIMAALAHVVVVVEAHGRSGALHTVDAADSRGVAVGVVPGSVRNPASAGTNALLAAGGVAAYRGVDDVLAAVEVAVAGRPVSPPSRPDRPEGRGGRRAAPSPLAARVRAVLDHDPAPLEQIVLRCGLPLAEVALGLEQLLAAHQAEEERGWWCRPRR